MPTLRIRLPYIDSFVWLIFAIVLLIGTVGGMGYRDVSYNMGLDQLPKKVYTSPVGTVASLRSCHRSGKYNYNCTVVFANGKSWDTDVTQWPDDLLSPGSVLSMQVVTQGPRQVYSYCRNDSNHDMCGEYSRVFKGDSDFNDAYARGN